MTTRELSTIGRNASVDFIGYAHDIPAKIDTGADSSAVWASQISVDKKGVLHFCLFAKKSPYYTGEVISTTQYSVAAIRSASGHKQVRYKVTMSIRIDGRRVRANVTLADRSVHKFPVLIGRRTLNGKFIVDVAKAHYRDSSKVSTIDTDALNEQLSADPYGFYIKHFRKDSE